MFDHANTGGKSDNKTRLQKLSQRFRTASAPLLHRFQICNEPVIIRVDDQYRYKAVSPWRSSRKISDSQSLLLIQIFFQPWSNSPLSFTCCLTIPSNSSPKNFFPRQRDSSSLTSWSILLRHLVHLVPVLNH